MSQLVAAEGAVLDQILDASYSIWNEGLSRRGYAQYYHAQLATPWARDHLRRWALIDPARRDVLVSAKTYTFDAVLDGRAIVVVGLGAVFTQPAHRGGGHARALVEQLLDRAARDGADLALLFSEIGPDYYARLGFTVVPTFDFALRVVEADRHGAPATLVRAIDDRDIGHIVQMGRARATSFRFHLDRDPDLVRYTISKKRLLAGLSRIGAREVQAFVAEEGAAAVAYVVISVGAGQWTIEELGDRDPSGARAGAILQVLIARDPAERRPGIRAWLPTGFCPPQLRIESRTPMTEMMIRPLTDAGTPTPALGADDVLYWHADLF